MRSEAPGACLLLQMLLGLTLLADNTQTLFTIFTDQSLPLTLSSYLIPIIICLTTTETLQPGPWNMGAYGSCVRTGAAVYLMLAIVITLVPSTYPLTAQNVPYVPIMWLGSLLCMQLCWWLPKVGGRHFYSGPVCERISSKGRVQFTIASKVLAPPASRVGCGSLFQAASPCMSRFQDIVAERGSHASNRLVTIDPHLQRQTRHFHIIWKSLCGLFGPTNQGHSQQTDGVMDSARSSPNSFYRQPLLRIPGEREAVSLAQSSPRHPAGYAFNAEAAKRLGHADVKACKVDSKRTH